MLHADLYVNGRFVGRVEVKNDRTLGDVTGDPPRGAYDVRLWKDAHQRTPALYTEGRIEDFDRARGCWRLLVEAVDSCLNDDGSPKAPASFPSV